MTVAPPPLLVITGFAPEARIAEGEGSIVYAGGSPARLRGLLESEARPPYRAVISFGIAGGLEPHLSPGAIVVATAISAEDQRWTIRQDLADLWAKRLAASGEHVVTAEITGAETQILSRREKEALRKATGAAAVDMESHVAAAFAAAHQIPFGAIRVVCDPAERTLPPLTGEAVGPDGQIAFMPIVRSLARQPSQLGALPGLARDAALAFAALRRVRAALGAGFGLGRLGLGEPLGDVL